MDNEALLTKIIEAYPNYDYPMHIIILKEMRKEIVDLDLSMADYVKHGPQMMIDIKPMERTTQAISLPASDSEQEVTASSQDRIQMLKEKYKGKWKVGPRKCLEDPEYIVCAICGKKGQTLTSSHLKKHDNMTKDEYKAICGYKPDMVLMSAKSLEKSQANFKPGGKAYEGQKKRREMKAAEKANAEASNEQPTEA